MPSIKQVVTSQLAGQNLVGQTHVGQDSNAAKCIPQPEPTIEKQQNAELILTNDQPAQPQEPTTSTPNTTAKEEVFEDCWKNLFTEIFESNHLIYHSLKDETPKYENDIISIEVKNGIQKEQFEMRKKAIVEYWRNHFTLNVDDIEITVNESKEEKKVIINSEDKFRNMTEQNPQLPEFLNILGFRMKD